MIGVRKFVFSYEGLISVGCWTLVDGGGFRVVVVAVAYDVGGKDRRGGGGRGQ